MKFIKRFFAIALCSCQVTLLAACAAPAPAGTPSSVVTSPLASPLPTPQPTPTRVVGTGWVTGRLTELSQPFAGGILYLTTLTQEASGVETAARLDRNNAPRAITDAEGNFTFYNVTPGRYTIIVDTVRDAYMLRKPNNGGDLIFEVAADKALDLGTLNYDRLPR